MVLGTKKPALTQDKTQGCAGLALLNEAEQVQQGHRQDLPPLKLFRLTRENDFLQLCPRHPQLSSSHPSQPLSSPEELGRLCSIWP